MKEEDTWQYKINAAKKHGKFTQDDKDCASNIGYDSLAERIHFLYTDVPSIDYDEIHVAYTQYDEEIRNLSTSFMDYVLEDDIHSAEVIHKRTQRLLKLIKNQPAIQKESTGYIFKLQTQHNQKRDYEFIRLDPKLHIGTIYHDFGKVSFVIAKNTRYLSSDEVALINQKMQRIQNQATEKEMTT